MFTVLPFVVIPAIKRAVLIRLKPIESDRLAACLAALLLLAAAGGGAVAATTLDAKDASSLRITWTPDKGAYAVDTLSRDGAAWRTVRRFGAGRLTAPGKPELPVETYLIGVPRGSTVRIRVLEALFEDLPGPAVTPALTDTLSRNGSEPVQVWVLDEPFYATSAFYPEKIAYAGKRGTLRYQDVVPVRIAPFRTVPSTGLLRRYTKIVLAVEFVPGHAAAHTAGKEDRPAGDEGRWEGIYRGAVLNYEQAKSFRSSPAPLAPVASKRPRTATEFKLAVRESRLYAVRFADLADKGLPAGVPTSSIAVYRRGWSDSLFDAGDYPFTERSLPLDVEDVDGDGVFGGDDRIVVFLPGFRDDRMKNDYDDRFAEESIYYLSTEGEARSFESRGGLRTGGPLPARKAHADSIRWEIDAVYNWNTPSDTVDNYFAMGDVVGKRTTEIDLPPLDPSGEYTIKAMTVGRPSLGGTPSFHRFVLIHEATGDTVLNHLVFGERGSLVRSTLSFPEANLVAGLNRFRYEGSRGPTQSTTIEGVLGYLDWYEVHGSFLNRAVNSYARFSSGIEAGEASIEVDGFDTIPSYLFDVTNIYSPVRIDIDSVRSGENGFTIVFRDTIDAVRSYVAATTTGLPVLDAAKITADTPTSIRSEEGDYLIVSHSKFLDAVAPLAEYRRSTGFAVRLVDIDDVYDEFNGGVKDPAAIRRYNRFGRARWSTPPGWMLLVGDGFEDYKGIAVNNTWNDEEFDYVPSFPLFNAEIVGSGDHWDASDAWYGLLDGGDDVLLDVLIGRFPAKEPAGVSAMVDKTIRYEQFHEDDTWRNRILFVADDEWTFDNLCMHDEDQRQFELNTANYAKTLKESAALGIDTVNIYLSRFTTPIHSECPCGALPTAANWADLDCTVDHARDEITPRFFDEMNRGVLMVNFQGHGNRGILTHEVILRHGWDYRGATSNISFDIAERSEANDRPYIFMAYGCSISEFERWRTQGFDAITEEMLRFDKGAAVATFGSTGIEFLGPNLLLNESILKYMFQTPGVVPGGLGSAPPWYGGTPRWTLGEITALGMNDFALSYPDWSEVTKRYVIFGDPALVLDAASPVFDVTIDGESAVDGQSLLGHADGSPVRI